MIPCAPIGCFFTTTLQTNAAKRYLALLGPQARLSVLFAVERLFFFYSRVFLSEILIEVYPFFWRVYFFPAARCSCRQLSISVPQTHDKLQFITARF